MSATSLLTAEPDGLTTTSIRRWALDKYRLVFTYGRLFSTGMKRKWPVRTYIDLYAGSGFSQIEETAQIYRGSPLLALGLPDPFDKYIFCERIPSSLAALRARVARFFPAADVRFVEGDCDEQIAEITSNVPTGKGVLSFCFADPFDLSIGVFKRATHSCIARGFSLCSCPSHGRKSKCRALRQRRQSKDRNTIGGCCAPSYDMRNQT